MATPYESPSGPLGAVTRLETIPIGTFDDVLRASARAAELDASWALPFSHARRKLHDIVRFRQGMLTEMGDTRMDTIQCTRQQAGALCSYLSSAAGVREFFAYSLLAGRGPRRELFGLFNNLLPYQGPGTTLDEGEIPPPVTLEVVWGSSCSAQLVHRLRFHFEDDPTDPSEPEDPIGSVGDRISEYPDKYLPLPRSASKHERNALARRRGKLGAAIRTWLDLLPMQVRHRLVEDTFERVIDAEYRMLERERSSRTFRGKREPNYFLCIVDAAVKILRQHETYAER